MKRTNDLNAYDCIRKMIISLKLKPNDPIFEQELANELNMSRTPVREALKRLESEGLISVYPFKGSFVAPVSLKEIDEICDLRVILEVWAFNRIMFMLEEEILNKYESDFYKALETSDIEMYHDVDDKFHNEFILRVNNSTLIKMYGIIGSQIARYRTFIKDSVYDYSPEKDMHIRIINYIKEKDFNSASNLLKKHLEDTKTEFRDALKIAGY